MKPVTGLMITKPTLGCGVILLAVETQLIDPNDCQSTGGHWNQGDKRQECYLIDLDSDRVFCLYRTSANLRWNLDCEVDSSPALTK